MSALLEPLDHLLGTRSKVRLLRVLIERDSAVSVREAARLADISHSAALRALEELEDLGVVQREEAGREHLISIRRGSYHVRHGLEPLFRVERQRTDAVFHRLQRLLSVVAHEARTEILSGMIFGSAARGEDRPESDLDLLVVVPSDEGVSRAHRELASRATAIDGEFGLVLSPLVLSLDQVEALRRGEATPVQDALREGRRVFGEHLADLIDG